MKTARSTIIVLISITAMTAVFSTGFLKQEDHKPGPVSAPSMRGAQMFVQYCASCHGKDAKGNGPAAIAMKAPPPDLTTLAKHNNGKFPAGYVGALLKFGRSLSSHGTQDMPVWGSRFKEIDPVQDPTGQQHVNDLVAYIESLQAK